MTAGDGSDVSKSIVGGGDVGKAARRLDEHPLAERIELPRKTVRRLAALVGVYAVGILSVVVLSERVTSPVFVVPVIVLLAFTFELLDSAAGMGFGTALAPALFVLGYDPLQVVSVLLLSVVFTGLTAGVVHNEMSNVTLAFRPVNDETGCSSSLQAPTRSPGSGRSSSSTPCSRSRMPRLRSTSRCW